MLLHDPVDLEHVLPGVTVVFGWDSVRDLARPLIVQPLDKQ